MGNDEFYKDGTALPVQHPDQAINAGLLIEQLCANLDTARAVLAQVLDMNVVTPAGSAMKQNVRWALKETHPATFNERHPNCG